ncbi:hypothetical protein AAHC03_04508 [Spirometra sp. Aus1]
MIQGTTGTKHICHTSCNAQLMIGRKMHQIPCNHHFPMSRMHPEVVSWQPSRFLGVCLCQQHCCLGEYCSGFERTLPLIWPCLLLALFGVN